MSIRRMVLVLLLLATPALAKDRDALLRDFRKITGDMGPTAGTKAFPDSVANQYLNLALEYAAVRSLSFQYRETITMVDDSLLYPLSRKAIFPRYAKIVFQDGNKQGVHYFNSSDLALKPAREVGWTLIDSLMEVTQDLATEYQVEVLYVAMPASMDSGGADCELTDVLEHALVNRAAGMALVSTRVAPLVQVGQAMQVEAKEAFDDYAMRHVLAPTDTLGWQR